MKITLRGEVREFEAPKTALEIAASLSQALKKEALAAKIDGEVKELTASGNGRLDAVSNAVKKQLDIEFSELTYEEHALTKGSSSQAITYVSITVKDGKKVWGAGIHDDIIASSIKALFSAINRSIERG